MTSRPRMRRLGVLAVAAALVLSACSGGDDETDGEAADGSSESASASPTPGVPKGTEITEPGSDLDFGQSAKVLHRVGKKRTVLDLKVRSAKQGSLKDFEGFILDDPYKKRGHYFYVQVSVKNAGKKKVNSAPVPLWGISGENTLLRAVKFKSSFKKCPTKNIPKNFKPGKKFSTCLVYLSPNKGSLEGVSYRPTEKFDPIEWKGKVKTLPEKKPKKKKKKGGKNS